MGLMTNSGAYTLGLNQLPFKQETNQVIYVENEYNEQINKFIQTNLDRITETFAYRHFDFCYIPSLEKQLLANEAILDYYAPYRDNGNALSCPIDSRYILNWMVHPENKKNITPSLIYYNPSCIDIGYKEAVCQFRGIKITPETHYDRFNDFSSLLFLIEEDIEQQRQKNKIRYHLGPHISCSIEIDEDVVFDEDAQILLDEMKEPYEKLKQKGYKDYFILKALRGEEKLSRMRITKDLNFYLTDYKKNGEPVQIKPIQKALFILFLRHPEGIYMKRLVEYKSELEDIYNRVRGPKQTLEKNMDSLTGGLTSSLRTHVSKIRGAFVALCDEHLANNYTIRGKNGEPKKISLPRNLISSECDWVLQPYTKNKLEEE